MSFTKHYNETIDINEHNIVSVNFDRQTKKVMVRGTNIPEQNFIMDEADHDDWHGVHDKEGNTIFDLNIWFDEGYGCQYVNLIKGENIIEVGNDYRNPQIFHVI